MQRRVFSLAVGAALAAGLAPAIAEAAKDGKDFQRHDALRNELRRIEGESGGRLGVCILDTATGGRLAHRAAERFPMCSTFKLLAAALVLHRVDGGKERLERELAVEQSVILPNSPLTELRVGQSMTMAQLCEAAITRSDNAAANLMLHSFGGPAALTAYARSLGDGLTRLDRFELALNEARPGDPRDTTTPAAMVGLMRALLIGSALRPASRDQLRDWLLANKTGDERLRARLPPGWRVGDKTGAGDRGTNNDVGIVWPPDRAPLLVAAYLTGTTAPVARRNAAIAEVGALLPRLV
jgi:beta-lactamase class A